MISKEEFYKNNKSYCSRPFQEIFSDSTGTYRFCCFAGQDKTLAKYTTQNTLPFEYFFSEEMEEVRNKMIAGEKIDACSPCYELEDEVGSSQRTQEYAQDDITFETQDIELKLRIHGSYCNLSCYMCAPYNSSTRRNEIKKVFGNEILKKWYDGFTDLYEIKSEVNRAVKHHQWEDILEDILNHIDTIKIINLTGGEPLQLPKIWEMLNRIPSDYAQNITLRYDTNLTQLEYKGQSIFDIHEKFNKVSLHVSADHIQDKLAWIRYPIDVEEFESNLRKAKHIVDHLAPSVSLLNIFDLIEIDDYYRDNFGVRTIIHNLVRTPMSLSIRNLTTINKQIILEKYQDCDYFDRIKSEIVKEPYDPGHVQMKSYCDKLSASRDFDWSKLWSEYD